MAVIDGRTWLEILGHDVCRDLLQNEEVGRLGIDVHGHPEIFPVNYAMDGEHVVFRIDPGTKMDSLDHDGIVAFEIDEFDRGEQTGWSVLVVGQCRRVRDTEELRRLSELPLVPWAHGEKSRWMKLIPTNITGRRLHGKA